MSGHHHNSEGITRGARMLRTALGPAIAAWLEDPNIVEVMLNPDGRLWVDRLADGHGGSPGLVFAVAGHHRPTTLGHDSLPPWRVAKTIS